MSQPEGQPAPGDALPAPASEEAAQHEVQQRLAHLFRHVGKGTDDLYLQALMARYRGVRTP
jgi:hypothetical protein